jgi:hypothetical protein
MTDATKANTSSHPPLWRWTLPQSGDLPRPEGQASRRLVRRAFPAWRSTRRRLWAELWYAGGAEGEIHVRTRGWEFVFPSHVAIVDVIHVLNGQVPTKH